MDQRAKTTHLTSWIRVLLCRSAANRLTIATRADSYNALPVGLTIIINRGLLSQDACTLVWCSRDEVAAEGIHSWDSSDRTPHGRHARTRARTTTTPRRRCDDAFACTRARSRRRQQHTRTHASHDDGAAAHAQFATAPLVFAKRSHASLSGVRERVVSQQRLVQPLYALPTPKWLADPPRCDWHGIVVGRTLHFAGNRLLPATCFVGCPCRPATVHFARNSVLPATCVQSAQCCCSDFVFVRKSAFVVDLVAGCSMC